MNKKALLTVMTASVAFAVSPSTIKAEEMTKGISVEISADSSTSAELTTLSDDAQKQSGSIKTGETTSSEGTEIPVKPADAENKAANLPETTENSGTTGIADAQVRDR